MDTDLVSVDLNVDSALLLQHLTGIDSFPPVLALLPNVYDPNDQDRVRAVVLDRLAEAHIVEDGHVHPQIAFWLECLYRPDMELVTRIVDIDSERREPTAVLRMSLVRSGDTHVLATRCDDHVVIQQLFIGERPMHTAATAVAVAFGDGPVPLFDPITVPTTHFDELADESPDEWRRGLIELGASRRTAAQLGRLLAEVTRRAEVLVIEHHDGGSVQSPACVSVFGAPDGRIVATPSIGIDGQPWCTFTPGDDAALTAAVTALVRLLPGRSWTTTTR